MDKILQGFEDFQVDALRHERELFPHLARRQEPWAMMTACADTREDPSHIPRTRPGELFPWRMKGAMAPACTRAMGPGRRRLSTPLLVLEPKVREQRVNLHERAGAAWRLLADTVSLDGWVCEAGTGRVFADEVRRNEIRPLEPGMPARMLPRVRKPVNAAFGD